MIVLTTVTLLGCKEELEEELDPITNKLVAVAGENINSSVQQEVTFDGSASHDGNQKPFTFQWTIKSAPTGSVAALLSQKRSSHPIEQEST